jgi:hypothetical protein
MLLAPFSGDLLAKEGQMTINLPNGTEVPLDGLDSIEKQNLINYMSKISEAQQAARSASETSGIAATIKKAATDPTELNQWRKLITSTIKDVANDLNVGVNEFISTPAGVIVTGLLVYNFAGKDMIIGGKEVISDIMDVVLGIPMWISVMLILFYLQRKYLGTVTIYEEEEYFKEDENNPDKITRHVKTHPRRVSSYKWEDDSARTTFSVILYISFALITLVTVMLIFT